MDDNYKLVSLTENKEEENLIQVFFYKKEWILLFRQHSLTHFDLSSEYRKLFLSSLNTDIKEDNPVKLSLLNKNYTYLFYFSVSVDPKETILCLISVVNNVTGKNIGYDAVDDYANILGVKCSR